jgi:hypothetical protein
VSAAGPGPAPAAVHGARIVGGLALDGAALPFRLDLVGCMTQTASGPPSGRVAKVDDDLDPAAYERLTGVSKQDYEHRLLSSAQSSMMGEWTIEPDDGPSYTRIGVLEAGSVESVSLDRDHPDVSLVVVLRSNEHPACRFGWRIPVWPAPGPDDPETGTPEGCAFILSIDLIEILGAHPGLPPCNPDTQGLTWVGL